MRGYPYGYHPLNTAPKVASLGRNNLYVNIDTAVNAEGTPMLLVPDHEFNRQELSSPQSETLNFDRKHYIWSRYDYPTRRHIYTPGGQATGDIQEGQERIASVAPSENGLARIGPRVNPNSVENWPIGGDRPQVDRNLPSMAVAGNYTTLGETFPN